MLLKFPSTPQPLRIPANQSLRRIFLFPFSSFISARDFPLEFANEDLSMEEKGQRFQTIDILKVQHSDVFSDRLSCSGTTQQAKRRRKRNCTLFGVHYEKWYYPSSSERDGTLLIGYHRKRWLDLYHEVILPWPGDIPGSDW
ncbi:hypothetical protein CEXT_701221 [Caerostris extrusa]|uniref:Uncharacterized protein n=1 Tax=Caerostris extrusa TaxID=172846 RepID=A0AAV4MCG9_CAEEX|nr:hypothetical protein CEXT_701221 [Caerostris extrusa]